MILPTDCKEIKSMGTLESELKTLKGFKGSRTVSSKGIEYTPGAQEIMENVKSIVGTLANIELYKLPEGHHKIGPALFSIQHGMSNNGLYPVFELEIQ